MNRSKKIFSIKKISILSTAIISITSFLIFNFYAMETLIIANANFYDVTLEKVFSLNKKKTAFIFYENNFTAFNPSYLNVYTQDGYLIKNSKSKKIYLNSEFTLGKNGGIKSVFFIKNNSYALVSSLNKNCYYAAIIELETSNILKKFPCLINNETIDFNALGGAYVDIDNKIYLSLGVGERLSNRNSNLAQNENSYYGKILTINKNQFDYIKKDKKLNVEFFSLGHRNPQGLTYINKHIYSVEHGPHGGDELNKILKNKNYGYPHVTYGGRYNNDPSYSNSFKMSDKSVGFKDHENSRFEEPLFVLTPSVGISSVSSCPSTLKKFYKKNCLISLTLNGKNGLIIVFILNDNHEKVLFHEVIRFNKPLRLRHFVTNLKNEIYEDTEGNIYVSADNEGIYKVNFFNFKKQLITQKK